MFCDDSYGYRPNKSALDAIEMTRKRSWHYDYVIELDVKGLFDNIDFPQAPFERYADNGVVHCRTKAEALFIRERLAQRFAECRLELHPTKTRIVYCKDKDRTEDEELTGFDFLGYTFKAVHVKCKDGKMRSNFIASVSKASAKTFIEKIKSLEIHKETGCKIDIIAEILNPMLRGWINYFGRFNPSAMKYTLQCVE